MGWSTNKGNFNPFTGLNIATVATPFITTIHYIYRPEDLRPGPFIIRLGNMTFILLFYCLFCFCFQSKLQRLDEHVGCILWHFLVGHRHFLLLFIWIALRRWQLWERWQSSLSCFGKLNIYLKRGFQFFHIFALCNFKKFQYLAFIEIGTQKSEQFVVKASKISKNVIQGLATLLEGAGCVQIISSISKSFKIKYGD